MSRYKKFGDRAVVSGAERAEEPEIESSDEIGFAPGRKPRPDLYFQDREQARRFLEADTNGCCGD